MMNTIPHSQDLDLGHIMSLSVLLVPSLGVGITLGGSCLGKMCLKGSESHGYGDGSIGKGFATSEFKNPHPD